MLFDHLSSPLCDRYVKKKHTGKQEEPFHIVAKVITPAIWVHTELNQRFR